MMRQSFVLAIFSLAAVTLSLFCIGLLIAGWGWRGFLFAGRPGAYSCRTIFFGHHGQQLVNLEQRTAKEFQRSFL